MDGKRKQTQGSEGYVGSEHEKVGEGPNNPPLMVRY